MDNITEHSLQKWGQDSSGLRRRRKYLTVPGCSLLGSAILGTFGFILHMDEGKGHGISKEFEGHIFKKFAQADLSDARTNKGTGLGLSISKALAELHGGSLTFGSVPDQETSFHLSLDLNRN